MADNSAKNSDSNCELQFVMTLSGMPNLEIQPCRKEKAMALVLTSGRGGDFNPTCVTVDVLHE